MGDHKLEYEQNNHQIYMMKKDNVKQWQELDLVNHPSSALPISFYE
jgi:hypothetical protein